MRITLRACKMKRSETFALQRQIDKSCVNCLLFARYPRLVRFSMQYLASFRRHVSAISSMHNTNAEREPLSPSSYHARVSQASYLAKRFLSSLVGARIVSLEICDKVIRVHHSIAHARCERRVRKNWTSRKQPEILSVFQKADDSRSSFHGEPGSAINASDRSDKSAAVAVMPSLCIHSASHAVFRSLPLGARKHDERYKTLSKARLR